MFTTGILGTYCIVRTAPYCTVLHFTTYFALSAVLHSGCASLPSRQPFSLLSLIKSSNLSLSYIPFSPSENHLFFLTHPSIFSSPYHSILSSPSLCSHILFLHLFLFLFCSGLLSVPAFKALTGLPPYLGMLAALGVLWTLTDAIHAGEGASCVCV